MDQWFTVDRIDEDTYIISEYRHWETHCYLLNGSGRSLLIDTGPGICNIYDDKMALLPVERVFPAHHSLDIQPEIIGRMRDAFRGLKEGGKLRHGSGTFDYGDWAVWL